MSLVHFATQNTRDDRFYYFMQKNVSCFDLLRSQCQKFALGHHVI
jgi:hypothetical protein